MKKKSYRDNFDILNKGIVAVACNDAGATNIIINWLKAMPNVKVKVHLGGPAINLWKHQFPDFTNLSLEEALEESSLLLSGTGWASSLEHQARSLASSLGIFSVAVIDHWVNYESRFFREGSFTYPDEIWVVDGYGFNLAKLKFPQINIKMLPNYYLDEQVAKIKKIEQTSRRHVEETNILVALEPIRDEWHKGDARPGEFQALDYFIKNISFLAKGMVNIRLRPHPSDHDGKYDKWIEQQSLDAKIYTSINSTLAEDVAWSNIVVGCQTYVLVIAISAGRRAIISMPPYAPKSLLPYPEIEEIRILNKEVS